MGFRRRREPCVSCCGILRSALSREGEADIVEACIMSAMVLWARPFFPVYEAHLRTMQTLLHCWHASSGALCVRVRRRFLRRSR